jgi:hypothetical protein
MITLEDARLTFRFPAVHERAVCGIDFYRTLRLPDDGRAYPLPAGLGRFPLRHIDDFASRLPASLARRGGVVMPMWQAEAMWIHFAGFGYPFAVKIAAGKINAVTGGAWNSGLQGEPPAGRRPPQDQDYVVASVQPWLDGFCVDKGLIRQFVAAPLGSGITAEEQITGTAEHGGIQIVAYPMKKEAYERLFPAFEEERGRMVQARCAAAPMGLAPGGLMRQEIYRDPYGIDVWDSSISSRCFITILNAIDWHSVTGEAPPSAPISANEYEARGIPWFDYYAADQEALAGSSELAGLKSIGQFAPSGPAVTWKTQPHITVPPLVQLGPQVRPGQGAAQVREGDL